MCTPVSLWVSTPTRNVTKKEMDGNGLRFLYLFSGPRTGEGSIQDEFTALGAEVDRYDIESDKSLDLGDDTVWVPIRKAIIAEHYHGAILVPPCTSLSSARRRDDESERGPEALRGETAPDIYGFKHLVGKGKEDVRVVRCSLSEPSGREPCF